MHFGVLGSPDSWYFRDLCRAAGDRHQLSPVGFREISAGWGPSGSRFASAGKICRTFDGLLVRTMSPGTLEQVVFRMDVLARLEAEGQVVLNPARAVEAAVDKYLATAKLAAAGLHTPPTLVCQTVDEAMRAFELLGGDLVLKPLFGSEGRGITRLNDPALAQRAFSMLVQLGAVLYLQPFIPHDGYDIRVLVVGRRLWAMKRSNPLDWRTNVSRGATAQAVELNDTWAELARRAADAIGAPIAGVDLLPGRDGTLYTLEVNAVPGWKALARAVDVDVAAHVLGYLEARARAKN